MTVEKFSVSMPADLAARLDEFAAGEGLSRSEVVREATADYLAGKRALTAGEERARRIQKAIDGMKRLAAEWGDDPKSSLEYLMEVRAEDTEGDADA